jgi:hypothetical protein
MQTLFTDLLRFNILFIVRCFLLTFILNKNSTCPRNDLPLWGIFFRIIDLVLQRGNRYELSFLRTPKKSIPNIYYYQTHVSNFLITENQTSENVIPSRRIFNRVILNFSIFEISFFLQIACHLSYIFVADRFLSVLIEVNF